MFSLIDFLSFSCLVLSFCIYTFALKIVQAWEKNKALEKWRGLQIYIDNLEDVPKTNQRFFKRLLKHTRDFT